MIHGLDLFSGIGGITLALGDWVRPVAYCEIDRYAQGVLLSRMADGSLPIAPIWDDITTLRGKDLPGIDIIYGGFPCQDISIAGTGKGLSGSRSGLFREIMRLVDEIRPSFIFLENVPAITHRGLGEVTAEITRRGYDCRWTIVSAAEVGAPHLRKRWFLLAHASGKRRQQITRGAHEGRSSEEMHEPQCHGQGLRDGVLAYTNSLGRSEQDIYLRQGKQRKAALEPIRASADVAYSSGTRLQGRGGGAVPTGTAFAGACGDGEEVSDADKERLSFPESKGEPRWGTHVFRACTSSGRRWQTEPDVGRVADGVPARVDRIKCLGNAVVPRQAREAFMRLIGKVGNMEKMPKEEEK